jgi:hypothetical protein
VENASVFLLRYIVHDWTNADSIRILKHLRAAATPSTNLVIIEKIVPEVSGDDEFQDIPGAAQPRAQSPLLPNWGVASAMTYMLDMLVRSSRFRLLSDEKFIRDDRCTTSWEGSSARWRAL